MLQGIHSAGFGFFHSLTHRTLGHAKGFGHVFLFPACLIQLPGSQAAIFAPAERRGSFLFISPLSAGCFNHFSASY
jgi:hypothetical protein